MAPIKKAASKVKTVKKKNGPCWKGYKKLGRAYTSSNMVL